MIARDLLRQGLNSLIILLDKGSWFQEDFFKILQIVLMNIGGQIGHCFLFNGQDVGFECLSTAAKLNHLSRDTTNLDPQG